MNYDVVLGNFHVLVIQTYSGKFGVFKLFAKISMGFYEDLYPTRSTIIRGDFHEYNQSHV